jgi:hypothetical protein
MRKWATSGGNVRYGRVGVEDGRRRWKEEFAGYDEVCRCGRNEDADRRRRSSVWCAER